MRPSFLFMAYTLADLSQRFGAQLHGDPLCQVSSAASLAKAGHADIGFAESPKYVRDVKATNAAALVLNSALLPHCPCHALVVAKPRLVFSQILSLLYPQKTASPRIHPSVVIGARCQIDASATIAANVVIGDDVTIAAGVVIHPQVTIYDGVIIGKNTVIYAGVVIGADGFGFEQNQQREWVKVPQVGGVVIGDDVEIGANTAIDRGALDDTVIGNGVKIDNQVMIAHNVHIGDHTVIAGCTGVAGSAKIGKHCLISGHCSINGHIELVDGVVVTGTAMVTHSLTKPGIYSSGTGILPHKQWRKLVVRFRQLDKMYRLIKKDGSEVV